jgi:hypothetical protein
MFHFLKKIVTVHVHASLSFNNALFSCFVFSFKKLRSIYFIRFKINVILAMYQVQSMYCAS